MFFSLLLIRDQAIWCLFFVSAVTTHDISRAALPKPLVLLLAPLHNTSNLVEFLVELHESDSACICTDSPGLRFPKWLWAKLIVANGFMISVGSQSFWETQPRSVVHVPNYPAEPFIQLWQPCSLCGRVHTYPSEPGHLSAPHT